MFKVGVTGGIGSGKSIICNVFHHLGIPVYQADTEARRLMGEDESIRTGLVKYFGGAVFQDEQLDRKYLADRIFSDSDARTFVNSLVHPAVRADFAGWVETRSGTPYVIEEAALLFETGAWKILDYNILIDAAVETRIERIVRRDGLARADVLARMASQMDPVKGREYADFIIHNEVNDFVIPQVLKVDKIIREIILQNDE
jgi:dephospho-CoA kinase